METVSENEVQSLKREVNRLQQEIAELKERHSEIAYMQLHRDHSLAIDERYIPNVTSFNKNIIYNSLLLSQMVKVNDYLNGITFSSIQKTKVASDLCKLDAECKSYSLLFHLACHLKTQPDDSFTVTDLKTTFQDDSLVEEIKHFINSCHRDKNIQELLTGLVNYAVFCKIREEVVSWLCNDCTALSVNCSVENGTYVIEMYGNKRRVLYLTCTWSVCWQKKTHMMSPSLTISVHKDGLSPRQQQYVRSICEKPPFDKEGMKEAWEEITDCVAKLK